LPSRVVIGKFTDLGWIWFRKHTRNLHCRILRCRAFRQGSGVAKEAARLDLRDQLHRNVTADGVRNCIHQAEFLNRSIVIDCQHAGDTERAGVIQLFPANACNHLRAYLLRRMHCGAPNTAQRSRYQNKLSLLHTSRCSLDGTGGSNKFSSVIFRLYGRHIKLATKLAISSPAAFVGMMAILQMNAQMREPVQVVNRGYRTQKLPGFVNRAMLPVQQAVDGSINLLDLIILAILIGLERVASYDRQHSFPFHAAFVILHVVWLVVNIYDIVSNELLSDDYGKSISWSFVTFVAWVFIVLSMSYITTTCRSLLVSGKTTLRPDQPCPRWSEPSCTSRPNV
jgi:hypothetical protein